MPLPPAIHESTLIKLLFIVSFDYGELGNALHFIDDIYPEYSPVLLLPPEFYKNREFNPDYRIYQYHTLGDIRQVVQDENPAGVFFFSGYLLTLDNVSTVISMARLIRFLKNRQIKILTSDPFVGQVGNPFNLSFTDIIASRKGVGRSRSHLTSWVLKGRLFIIYRLLKKMPHIYPGPFRQSDFPDMSCFYSCDYSKYRRRDFKPSADPEKSWLFVLSQVDFDLQYHKKGTAFIDDFEQRIKEVLQMGGSCTISCPDNLRLMLKERLPGSCRLNIYSSLPYADYMTKLIQAEYVFFWNFFSFSLIYRILNRRPVFFFSEGHVSTIIPAIMEIGIRNYYQGWIPPKLNIAVPLNSETLKLQSRDFRSNAEQIIRGFRRCPAPKQIIRSIFFRTKNAQGNRQDF